MLDDLVTQTASLPRGDVRILQPREVAGLPDNGAIEWAPIAPYWAVLWRSGVALAAAVEEGDLAGARVIELGCGLGLPSIGAARCGADVLATDVDPEAIELLARNARANGAGLLEGMVVDWTRPDELLRRGPFDLVLAADVAYEARAVEPLLELMPRLAPAAWLADPGRAPAAFLLARAKLGSPIETRTEGAVAIHRLAFA